MKKYISLLLIFMMSLVLNTSAMASNMSVNPKDVIELDRPGTSTSTVVLTADLVQFSVVVPTKLPLHIRADGRISTAENAEFINRSYAPVRVTRANIIAAQGWSLAPYHKDMKDMALGSQEIGFILNGVPTLSKGRREVITFDRNRIQILGRNPGISEDVIFPFDYHATGPVQTKAITNELKIADVVFTIGWDM